MLEARRTELLTEYDRLLVTEAETLFGTQRSLIDTHKKIDKLRKELPQLYAQRDESEAKLREDADIKIQASVIIRDGND